MVKEQKGFAELSLFVCFGHYMEGEKSKAI